MDGAAWPGELVMLLSGPVDERGLPNRAVACEADRDARSRLDGP